MAGWADRLVLALITAICIAVVCLGGLFLRRAFYGRCVPHFITSLLCFVVHLVTGAWGIGVISAMSFYSVKPILGFFFRQSVLQRDAILLIHFFPIQCCTALITGFVLFLRGGSIFRNRVGTWVWLFPALWFLLNIMAWESQGPTNSHWWYYFFLSSQPLAQRRQLITTLPLLTSVLYAVGLQIGRIAAIKWRVAHSSLWSA